MIIKKCQFCLHERKLCKSHIIPKSFYELDSWLISDTLQYPKRRRIGEYVNDILCVECEHYFNVNFDDYAKKTLIDLENVYSTRTYHPLDTNKFFTLYRLANTDEYEKILVFFISILWRASVTKHKEFQEINLGPFQDEAKQILKNKNINQSKNFEVALFLLTDLKRKINIYSKRTRIENVTFYILIVGSIKVYIKCDKRPFPSELHSLISNETNDILMCESKLSEHKEYAILRELAYALYEHQNRKMKLSFKEIKNYNCYE